MQDRRLRIGIFKPQDLQNLPIPSDESFRNGFHRVIQQVLPNAAEVLLQEEVPVDLAHVEEEHLLVASGQLSPQCVDVVHLEVPLAHGEVLDHVHEAVNLLVGTHEPEK